MEVLPDGLGNSFDGSRTGSFLLSGVERKPLNLLVFDLLDDPVLHPGIFCADFQFLQIVQIIEVIPDTMFFIFMLFKELSSFFYGGFISKAYQTFIALFVLDLLLYVSEPGEFINDDGCCQVGDEDVEEGPVYCIRKQSAVVTAVAHPAGGLPNNSLGQKRVNTAHKGAAVGVEVANIKIDGLVLKYGPYEVVDAEDAEDKVEGQGQQGYQNQLAPGDADSREDVSQQLYFCEYVENDEAVYSNLEETAEDGEDKQED